MSDQENKKFNIYDLNNLWIEYDKQNDSLYIYFAPENVEAEESFLIGEDVIVAVKDDSLISITIMNFSKRIGVELC
ncbi:MAG: DUF2283 domain-containing protein [Desulfurococcales archaeon]|nr:DUF2283 domain-containing protein [Desulfurococcales archaeon]MCC6062373.1 DUF2283 domain-containing protein [Desulfurococcales archaeon]MCI4457668.1 DUF2283 domain-containing protein [Desulfurococcaceae archaeon]